MRDSEFEAALDRVLELTVLLGRDATSSLARMGLTEARAHVLWVLRSQGPCTQRALASAMGITPRAVTALVDGLAATGFVTREPVPADRRAVLVTATELGRSTIGALADGHRELARHLFGGMPAAQFDCFDAGLTHVLDHLRTALADPGQATAEGAVAAPKQARTDEAVADPG